ncbi:DNA methyltransferase [Magnetospirillum sp. UT-4]|uniref:DNA methyltransferase n=1 Tax=Magnetospirillum sp. UT-4 TaxID=2681467 RepID=UPI0013822E99|nr:DNA methyltransferase [Magnetospirillum sp. UT-4]CAA7615791.1 DNA modification methylase [Magnetospirillum sp. UT-4]
MTTKDTTGHLFTPAQPDLLDASYEEQLAKKKAQPVECLGHTFPSDQARREHYLGLLREKLKDPEFLQQPGFPLGKDEDILRLSDPPYYTACPNPFLADFVRHVGTPYDPETDSYTREPFAIDVSEGKTDALYTAHAYHTKVPHKAIMPAILHYTKPGDLVLDGFCGSGMTGVAAQMCGAADSELRRKIESDFKRNGLAPPTWGARTVVLNDLSPAASFIAANYNIPFDVKAFQRESKRILKEMKAEIGWMYETLHSDGKTKAQIEYTVWSEVFSCPDCAGEIVFVNEALDIETKRTRDTFPCPHCGVEMNKDRLARRFTTGIDPADGSIWQRITLRPVIVVYSIGKTRYEKAPDAADFAILEKITALPFPGYVPDTVFPIETMSHGSRISPKGFTRAHHFFLPRATHALSRAWAKAQAIEDTRLRNAIIYFIEQAIWGMSVLARYTPTHFSQVNQYLSGVYYIGSQIVDVSPWYILDGKLDRLVKAFREGLFRGENSIIRCGTAASLGLQDASIDYIFTDPPFGENIFYADLNYLVESWHKIWTKSSSEVIVDKHKKKSLHEYQSLMRECFLEYYRALKPARWMTVVFHNSQNAVWNAIQEALLSVGFVIADVRMLDKKQGSYRQLTSTAVKQDLVISAYKPCGRFERSFVIKAGTKDGVWEFVDAHLAQLPVFVSSVEGQVDVLAERLDHRLFDRMVAFHLQRNISVPLSVAEFYAGLESRFRKHDGMYFLASQEDEYQKKRAKTEQVRHLEMFPDSEANTIQWLRQELGHRPRSYANIQPEFMKLSVGWARHDKPVELADILDQNFLHYDGTGDVPSQIHAYLSSNYKDYRNLAKDAPELRAKAKDRWYVPDPNKLQDLEAKREKQLLREFDEMLASRVRIKQPRHEVIRAGFKRAWGQKDYATIKAMAAKIPEEVIQEDQQLLMWYDMALTRLGDD